MKMTFQPKKRHRSKVHGFRKRMSTANGRKVLAARRAKGRKRLSAQVTDLWPFSLSGTFIMKHIFSLKNSLEFGNVYKRGKSYANKYLVMYITDNDLGINRLGISVSKKVGNSVVRHRITRLIREVYRLQECRLIKGKDIVVVARVNSKGHSYWDIESAFLHLAKLHHILDSSEEYRADLS